MKCLRYIVLLVSVLLVAACEQLSLPDTTFFLTTQRIVETTESSAVIEIEFYPTAATIQTVTACYTGGLKKEMTHVKGLVYRVELKNLQSDTEYHVYYEVSNVFSTVVVNANCSFITVESGEKPDNPNTPTATPEYVDLGLPSGVKWATFNVGATKPEEYGDYFAWGETEPKELYDWSTYKWCDGSYNTLTKYNTDSEYGVVDNKKILESSDDAAYVNWGGNWRMPSVDEWNELLSHCSLKWEERNGVSGVTLVSVQNGNSLFFPAAGVYHYDNGLVNLNVEGWYRTNSLDESRGTISLGFSYTGSLNWYANDRCFGQPVRPVYGSRAEETTLPTVVTSMVTQITETSAVVGGNVTSDGGASVTERGVVYSTNPNPVITNLSNTIRPCGSGAGEFTYTITGLQPATTYYVRAYARNDQGTAYGEEMSFTTQTQIEKPTSPYFSVSQTKYITFSPGNLQYHPANNEWRFAPSQLDYIGDANSNCSSTYNGWLDLFGWSTSATNFGVSASQSINDYSGSFVDWGTNTIGNDEPNTWRTLTFDEWYYLRYYRTNANDLVGVAQVNGVNGLIFLPDTWVCPEGITFKSGFPSSYGVDDYAAYQTFTADQWSKLEAAGAVFLPAAGRRDGSGVLSVQYNGDYWSATEDNSFNAGDLGFYPGGAYMGGSNRDIGKSVRLVKDL